MKTALLLHGTGGSNTDYFWFADTKKFLEDHGYYVWWPLLPHTEKPNLQDTCDFIKNQHPDLDAETIIIGHSSAAPAILHLLEGWVPVKQVVLVGGFYQSLDDDGYSDAMLPEQFYWDTIKTKADQIIMINSDNDPWGATDIQARTPAVKLGATLIVPTGQGHMGSLTYEQPYREFPLLKTLLLV
ncbi:MAG: putative Alpha/beta fold family hydrolase [Candidatus Saccharibacteria bacterium]|nr:putative Alpha/beta fold family hydrolase [Candidatus Saccharibacteria bacterium]